MQPQKRKSNLLDNPFYRLMGTIGDLVVLNVLWLVCCLPVVRAGGGAAGGGLGGAAEGAGGGGGGAPRGFLTLRPGWGAAPPDRRQSAALREKRGGPKPACA